MFRKDYLLSEIEKLALMIAKLMGLKADGKADEFICLANDTLLHVYNISPGDLTGLTSGEFKQTLERENYSAAKLDALAQLLYLYTEPFNPNAETLMASEKILYIFDVLEHKHHWQSFENIAKRNFILQYLSGNFQSSTH